MSNLSSDALNAAIRAVQGESDMEAVRPALAHWRLAPVIAFTPNADRIMRSLAALSLGANELLSSSIVSNPALHDAVARMIGTYEGLSILASWAKIAPEGWGAAHADALIKAVQRHKCFPQNAAALIGPRDAYARLRDYPSGLALAIRNWGQSTPENPTAWMEVFSSRERDWMIAAALDDVLARAHCLPWLPPDRAIQMRIDNDRLFEALDAFAEASPTARAQHAATLQRLVAQAHPGHLGELTRLACVMKEEAVWERVQTLIRESPNAAYHVVVAAPWNDLEEIVRTAILEHSNTSDMCAAVAAARGGEVVTNDSAPAFFAALDPKVKVIRHITNDSAAAFFAALDPKVWDALPSAEQRRWRDALPDDRVYLAVRSLGPRPEFLAKAIPNNDLVKAAVRHASDDAALHWALLPVALRDLPVNAVHQLITALLTPPPAPGAFFFIAGRHADSSVVGPAQKTLQTIDDLACAVALQRNTEINLSIQHFCATLRNMLHGRSWDNVASIMALLTDAARAGCMPDRDTLAKNLAHPNRKDAMRQALARLETLPPDVAIPTFIALNRNASDPSSAATAIADALRDHGDVFLAIVDAILHSRLRDALLPQPNEAALADALRTLAREDPFSAHRLALALNNRSWRAELHAVMHTLQRHADVVGTAPDDAMRSEMVADPIVTLALAAVQSNNAELRNAGVAALAARLDILRVMWDNLPQETQKSLRAHPDIAVVVADIPPRSPLPTARRGRIR